METAKLSLLRSAMDAYAQRRRALSSNIANVDTPGYRRASVSFEEELRAARESGGIEVQAGVDPQVEVEDGPPVLEDELMGLADTQMRTRLATRALSEHFNLMRTGITGNSN